MLAALRHKIPAHHAEWILQGGWVRARALIRMGIRLNESDLCGLSGGMGGRGVRILTGIKTMKEKT